MQVVKLKVYPEIVELNMAWYTELFVILFLLIFCGNMNGAVGIRNLGLNIRGGYDEIAAPFDLRLASKGSLASLMAKRGQEDVVMQPELELDVKKNISLDVIELNDSDLQHATPLNESDERDLLRLQLRVAQVRRYL